MSRARSYTLTVRCAPLAALLRLYGVYPLTDTTQTGSSAHTECCSVLGHALRRAATRLPLANCTPSHTGKNCPSPAPTRPQLHNITPASSAAAARPVYSGWCPRVSRPDFVFQYRFMWVSCTCCELVPCIRFRFRTQHASTAGTWSAGAPTCTHNCDSVPHTIALVFLEACHANSCMPLACRENEDTSAPSG